MKDRMEKVAEDFLEEYRERGLPRLKPSYRETILREDNSRRIDRSELLSYVEEIDSFYSELFEKEDVSEEKIESKTFYDIEPSAKKWLKRKYAADFGGLTPLRKNIVISPDKMPEKRAYKTFSSEIFHLHQHRSSETWNDRLLREGLERSASLRQLREKNGEDWEDLTHSLSTYSLINGYANILKLEGELEAYRLENIGLSEQEAKEFVERSGCTSDILYDVGAALIFSAEEDYGDQIYRDVFNGDYENLEGLSELRENMPWTKRFVLGARTAF